MQKWTIEQNSRWMELINKVRTPEEEKEYQTLRAQYADYAAFMREKTLTRCKTCGCLDWIEQMPNGRCNYCNKAATSTPKDAGEPTKLTAPTHAPAAAADVSSTSASERQ
jgi:hypothetical protein